MSLFSWKRRPLAQQLSAYLDGELDERETAATAENLVFDADARRLLRAYGRLEDLTRSALAPAWRPDPAAATERLLQTLGVDAAQPAVPGKPSSSNRRSIKPAAILASIGLVVTAGVALAGLRRRGLV